MFKKMIVVSEASNASSEMVKSIRSLKSLGVNECLLLQCYNPQEIDTSVSPYFISIFNKNLENQSLVLVQQGFEVKTRIISGNINNEIKRIATEEDYSLIVVGAERHSIIGGLFLGGIAYETMYGSSKPVLLVRDKNKNSKDEDFSITNDMLEHILFPTDFSENADIAFEYVKEMVKKGLRKVTITHIQDESKINPYLLHRLIEFNEIDESRLEQLKATLLTLNNVDVDIQIEFGSPTSEILKIVEQRHIPLIVMGTQGRGFIKEIFMGSVSHNIVRHASSSVLLIPGTHEN